MDPDSGYRRYRREQARRARQIAMLRWDGLPIEGIRRIIDDPAGRRRATSWPTTGAAWNASETC